LKEDRVGESKKQREKKKERVGYWKKERVKVGERGREERRE
jgi:hypothetical protein